MSDNTTESQALDDLRNELLGVVWLAVHQEAQQRGVAPGALATDPSFTLRVVNRMFGDRAVALAWRAARGADWLEG